MASISAGDSMSIVWRQPERAIFRKWMICGTTLLGPASWHDFARRVRPGTNSSDEMRRSGPLLAEWTAIASTTMSPTCPFAKRV
jgi:hypothetical protein